MYRCRYVDTKTKVHKLNIAAYPYKHFVLSAYIVYIKWNWRIAIETIEIQIPFLYTQTQNTCEY